MHNALWVSSKSGVFVSSSTVESCDQTLLAFHATYSEGLLFPVPEPQLGEPDVEHRSLTPLGEPL